MNYQIVNGMVQVPLKEFTDMRKRLENAYDEAILERALENTEEFYPAALVKDIVNGKSPVRAFREYRGMSQAALADKAGVAVTQISMIETGKRNGSIDTIKAIAEALDVTIDEIV